MKSGVRWALALGLFLPAGGAAQTAFPALPDTASPGTGLVVPCSPEGVDGTARCGRFRVYEDREGAAGRTIDVAFVILDATGPDATADRVLIPLPGGPGQTFTGGARIWAGAYEHLRSTHDVLLVDVRGVGASAALDCPAFQIPVEERFGTMFPPEHIRMCRDSLSARARLDLYTTDLSVDDLEELRRWLGYPVVDLIGGSYGTRVAQVYMRRHPDAVRSAILNSVVPVFEPGYVHMARSLQTSLDLVVRGCETDRACAAQNPGLSARLDTLLHRLERAPAEVRVRDRTVAFTLGDFSYAVRGLLYGRAGDVPGLLMAAAGGDWSELAEYYLVRSGWIGEPLGSAGYHFSALCAEDIAPLTDAQVRRLTEGTFMGDHLISGYRDVCARWDVAALPPSWWSPVRSALPVLVISGERDPVTPPAWGDAVAEHLPNSVHVIVPGGGHVPGNACVRSLERRFLTDAEVAGLDASCIGGA